MTKLQEKRSGTYAVRSPVSVDGGWGCLHPSRDAPRKGCGQDDSLSLPQHPQHCLLAFCFPKYDHGGRQRKEPWDQKCHVSILLIWSVAASSACLRSTVEPRKLSQRLCFLGSSSPNSFFSGDPRL